jgi:hypothetical protein
MNRCNKHIIIVGSARSGTSWLCELMARPLRYRLLFEPEHEFQTPKGKLLCDQWISKKEDTPKGYRYLRQIFANKVDNNWIAQHSNRKWKRHLWPFVPKRFVIKFVRCNLSAPFMNEAFGIPVLHIIRDPFEVLDSQRRVKFPWLYNLKHFQQQEKLVEFVARRYHFDLNNLEGRSDLEKLTLRWCIENAVALESVSESQQNYKVIRYDDLRNDSKVFKEICREFQFDWVSNLEERYKKPSSKAHAKGGLEKGVAFLKFSQTERALVQALLEQFELSHFTKPEAS